MAEIDPNIITIISPLENSNKKLEAYVQETSNFASILKKRLSGFIAI